MNTIIDTGNMAEACDFEEDESPREDMAATKQSDPNAQIEFHVQMRSWTLRDMEGLIVEAAATQLIQGFGNDKLAKMIEDQAIAAITAKADAKIDAVTSEIIDQPLTPSFGDRKPVTMREFIGLYGKEYLTERVDREGKPSTGGYNSHSTHTRAELAVIKAMDRKFKLEIEKATSAVIGQIQSELRAAHDSILAEEKARIRNAISKLTA